MSDTCTIALDAMGGDHGPGVVVPAALEHLKQFGDTRLILVGREDVIRPLLNGRVDDDRLWVRNATQEVEMDELPSRALRGKKDSSMRVALNLVKDGTADACVSAGNTGALMATARFVLKTLPCVDRPAIITTLPSLHGHTWVLDLGANVDCSAEHLFQFAVMGSELVSALEGVDAPRVGLLNIGQEEIKGNEQVKQAHELLSASDLRYVGYIEGDDLYLNDTLDIAVTDGFVGNVALKTSEGVAKMIRDIIAQEFKRSILTKIAALCVLPILKGLRGRIDPRRYNGASLLGLRGVVIKSHGGADALAFNNAIGIAIKAVKADAPNKIALGVERHLDRSVDA